MTTKTLKFPALPTGLTMTVQARNINTLDIIETLTLTEGTSGALTVYSCSSTGTYSGQVLWVLLASGAVLEHRVRTIADTAGPWVILTELEQLASAGVGASPLTITVTDGTDELSGATVRVTAAGVALNQTTGVDGLALFALTDGDYDVTVVRPGYGSEYVVVTVSGTSAETIPLTESAVTPPASPLVATGTMLVLDELAEIEEGVDISLQLTGGPGTAGYALDTKVRTATSDVDGLVEFAGLIRGAEYSVWRGTSTAPSATSPFSVRASGNQSFFTVPNTDTFSISEILGRDAEA